LVHAVLISLVEAIIVRRRTEIRGTVAILHGMSAPTARISILTSVLRAAVHTRILVAALRSGTVLVASVVRGVAAIGAFGTLGSVAGVTSGVASSKGRIVFVINARGSSVS